MSNRTRTLAAVIGAIALTGALAVSAHASHYDGKHLATLNGHNQPYIWFVDRTDSTWPVSAAATEWDRTSRVHMQRIANCPDAGDYCIPVHQVSSLPGGDYGVSYFVSYTSPTHISRYYSPYIKLSNTTPSNGRRAVACHEEGHWFHLTHRLPSSSCMRTDLHPSSTPTVPDDHDFNQIYNAYGHTH